MSNHIGDANKMVGAAQEAVPYGYVFTDDPTKFAMPGSGFHFGPVPPTDAINVIPLYAAPVAAAPVDLDAHGLRALDTCIADLRRLLGLAQDYDLDVMQMQSLETAIESLELRKIASTPATSGIDLPAMPMTTDREPDDSMPDGYFESNLDWARRPENADGLDWFIENHAAIRLLLDASPKGGSDLIAVVREMEHPAVDLLEAPAPDVIRAWARRIKQATSAEVGA